MFATGQSKSTLTTGSTNDVSGPHITNILPSFNGDDKNAISTKNAKNTLNFNYSTPGSANNSNNNAFMQGTTNVQSFSSGKQLNHDIPQSPRFDTADPVTLKNGPTLGSVLQQPRDTTPTRITMIGENNSVRKNLSDLTNIANLPTVPNITSSLQTEKPEIKIAHEDIRSLSEKANTIIQQYGMPIKAIPVQTPSYQQQQQQPLPSQQQVPLSHQQQQVPFPSQQQQFPLPSQQQQQQALPSQQQQQQQVPLPSQQQQQQQQFQQQPQNGMSQQFQATQFYNMQQQAQQQNFQQYQMFQELQREQMRQQQEFLKNQQQEKQEKQALQDHGNPNIIYTMEQDAKIRADYRVKFGLLRDAYPKLQIPEPGEFVPIYLIYTQYQQYVKSIHVDSSVESNKTYLLIVWLVIEVFCTKLLGLPCSGYTQNQFQYMNKYQMLLVELGEKTYNATGGSSWPIELKLAGLAFFNALVFVLIQYLVSTVGGSAAGEMGNKIREVVDAVLNQNRGADVLRRAQEATADFVPPPAPAATNPLGNMNIGGMDLGNLVASMAQMFTGGNNATAEAKPAKPRQKPTPYGRAGTAQGAR